MKISGKTTIIILCIFLFAACKDFNDILPAGHSSRVKSISMYDNEGNKISTNLLTYEKNRLVLCQLSANNETNIEFVKKNVYSYVGNDIYEVQYVKSSLNWESHQRCIYKVYNSQVHEKLISRLTSPECIDCWKYKFSYIDSKLVEWSKEIKNESNNWDQIRKDNFIYSGSILLEYHDFVKTESNHLRLDYKKTYTYKNGKLSGWEGGICIDDAEWTPTRKMEYMYNGPLVTQQTYFIRNEIEKSWSIFGFVNFYYDENNNLIEEKTSSGITTYYEYEEGCGNAQLFLCEPSDVLLPAPYVKSGLNKSETTTDYDTWHYF